MLNKADLQNGLSQCIGTTQYFIHWSRTLKYTDGIKFLADNAGGGSYWLIDVIASYNRKEPFQLWELKVKDTKAVLTMKEDRGEPTLVKQEITYTDFPLDEITLYLIDGILLLTSEY
jgi:hypothetical protein